MTIVLVLMATVWSFATGIAFARDTWLDPGVMLFGMLGTIVLAITQQLIYRERWRKVAEMAWGAGYESRLAECRRGHYGPRNTNPYQKVVKE